MSHHKNVIKDGKNDPPPFKKKKKNEMKCESESESEKHPKTVRE